LNPAKETITKQHYDKESKFYDKRRFGSPHGRYVNEIEQRMIINELTGHDVLELCCATGRFAKQIISKGFNYYGIDFSEKMIKEARKKNEKSAKFKVLNVNNLSQLPKKSFDSIFVSRALKFWNNPQQVIDDCHNLLRNQGKLIIHFRSNNFLPHMFLYYMSNTLKMKKYLNRTKMLNVQGVGTERKYLISEVVKMMKKGCFKKICWKSHFNFIFYSVFDNEFIIRMIKKFDNHFNFGQKSMVIGVINR